VRTRSEGEPWVTFIDSLGCYWIEEYPTLEPSRTLNGFIYAIWCLYEYALATSDTTSHCLLQASLSTVKNYIPAFRRLGNVSYYGLTFHYYASDYHLLHIRQLRILERMCQDTTFGDWADSLEIDFNEVP